MNLSFEREKNETKRSLDENFQWIIPQIITTILLLCTVWFMVVIPKYSRRKLNRLRNNCHIDYRMLWVLALTSPYILFIRLVITQTVILISILIQYDVSTKISCEILIDFAFTFDIICILCMNNVFWLRQRIIYRSTSWSFLNTYLFQCFSWLVFIGLHVGAICIIITDFNLNSFHLTRFGCGKNPKFDSRNIVIHIGFCLSYISQIVLFFLFVYPLKTHRRRTVVMRRQSLKRFNNLKKSDKLKQAIRSATITTFIYLFMGVCTHLIVTFLTGNLFVKSFDLIAHDIKIFVSLLSMYFGFTNGNFFPCCVSKQKVINKQNIITTIDRFTTSV